MGIQICWQLIVIDLIPKLTLEVEPGCIVGAEFPKIWRANGKSWCSSILFGRCRAGAGASLLERDNGGIETGPRVGLGSSYEASCKVAPVVRAVNLIEDLGGGLDRPQERGLG